MSAILSADDLNDFITPGVACIKPVETLPANPAPDSNDANSNNNSNSEALEHEVILDGQQPQQQPAPGAPAEISLTDCLACSGCVTSAEAVLVSLQSHAEVLSTLDGAPALRPRCDDAGCWSVGGLENPDSKLFVASVSPQSRASLAATAGPGVTERAAGRMLAQLLQGGAGLPAGGRWGNGFAWVADTNAAREACLVLGAEEVLAGGGQTSVSGAAAGAAAKPILTSSCPGWVCYAEKTHPHVLPHLSRVKSPQALMGTMLKTSLSRTLGIPPDRIWHLAVMPCFDKKLEASREELTDAVWAGDGQPGRGVRDVDCVITSKEILMLAESRNLDFCAMPAARQASPPGRLPFPDPALDRFLFPGSRRGPQADPAAGTSGGNLYFTLQYVAARHPGSTIETIRGRNADVVEYAVKSAVGEPLFKAARYYGFRNIQNLVRKLKPARQSRMPGSTKAGAVRRPAGKSSGLEYAYVEVMACPGGCTNGGGQVKVEDPVVLQRYGLDLKPGPQEQKQWLAQVDEAYFSASDPEESGQIDERTGDLKVRGGDPDSAARRDDVVGGISPSYIQETLAHWAGATSIDVERLATTSFREVVSDVGKDKPSDTERVVQLAGKIGGGW